jgi:hypothetical protein
MSPESHILYGRMLQIDSFEYVYTCAQELRKADALMEVRDGDLGRGGAQRSSSTGGSAYGIPRNARTVWSELLYIPLRVPEDVTT